MRNGQTITHMKLHKLLYYAQGYNLALFNQRFFDGEFKKWTFGPVCVEVYEKFKNCGSGDLPFESIGTLNTEAALMVHTIWARYGGYSAWQLSEMSHAEAPWCNAVMWQTIPDESLKAYFAGKLRSAVESPS
jgi:uncharacterized phage-associated protein